MTPKPHTWEVYGASIGFLGYVTARTEKGAIKAAKALWPDVVSFSVRSL